jgi:hypothetical protein
MRKAREVQCRRSSCEICSASFPSAIILSNYPSSKARVPHPHAHSSYQKCPPSSQASPSMSLSSLPTLPATLPSPSSHTPYPTNSLTHPQPTSPPGHILGRTLPIIQPLRRKTALLQLLSKLEDLVRIGKASLTVKLALRQHQIGFILHDRTSCALIAWIYLERFSPLLVRRREWELGSRR